MKKGTTGNRLIALILSAVMLISWWTVYQSADAAGTRQECGRVEVHYIDVGQGDATLILSDGHAMLIDAGNNSKGTAVQNYLQKQGVKKLDYVIGTHPDADHIGGLDVVIYKFDCREVLLPDYRKDTKTYEEVEDTLKVKNYKAVHPDAGDKYLLGDAFFTVVSSAGKKFDSANDYSVAVRLEYGRNHFLLVGDAEAEAEQAMLKSGQNLSADVYKVSHHGSKTGTSEEFLEAVNPEYAVISCGEDNSYGHPHGEVLNLLRKKGIKVFRTDEQGTIVAVSDGKKITWNMSPDESWKAGEPKGTGKSAPEPAKNITYILNTNTKKIHLPSCDSTKKIASENKRRTKKVLRELESEGYVPCKNCLGK